jgi:hypothetical protein
MWGKNESARSHKACSAHRHTLAKWISVKEMEISANAVEDFKTALILNGLRVAPASNTTNEQGCKRLDEKTFCNRYCPPM